MFYFFILFLFLQLNIINSKHILYNADNDYYCSNSKEQLCTKNEFLSQPNGYHQNGEKLPKAVCEVCDLIIYTLKELVDENKIDRIIPFVTFFCNEFKIESPAVCDLVVKEYAVNLKLVLLNYMT
jgi:benzoyl-CoA reductase/2-hydroxyglutaryl-CoA dehydratase subunit BcrC/BadD/HgdB